MNSNNHNNRKNHSSKRSQHNHRHHHRRPPQGGQNNRGPEKKIQLTPDEEIRAKHQQLLDQHIEARRKYFELYYRAENQQLDKLERLFNESLEKLVQYEKNLAPEKLALVQNFSLRQKSDLIYSQNHGLPEKSQDPLPQGPFDDPHLLNSQKDCDFSQDREESTGTLEDYKNYKGIS